jgi:hypothetical protein
LGFTLDKSIGSYFTHTASHWQTPLTYKDYLAKIIKPHRLNVIAAMSLSPDQKCIVKHDLHYSHYDPTVLSYMEAEHMLPLFVPAKCTDVLQEMDIVVNKPFKVGMKSAFRDYLHQQFNECIGAGGTADSFRPKLGMTQLKPQMVHFVETGMSSLRTPEFAATLRNCFAENGCVAEMRRRASLLTAAAAINPIDQYTTDDFAAFTRGHLIDEPENADEEAAFEGFFGRLHVDSDSDSTPDLTSDSDSEAEDGSDSS